MCDGAWARRADAPPRMKSIRAAAVGVIALQLLPAAVQGADCGCRAPGLVDRPAGHDRARPEGPRAVSWLGRTAERVTE